MPRRRVGRTKELEALARAKKLAQGALWHMRRAEKASEPEVVTLHTRGARRCLVEAERELNGFMP